MKNSEKKALIEKLIKMANEAQIEMKAAFGTDSYKRAVAKFCHAAGRLKLIANS